MSEERIRRLEEQVAHLYAHLGLSPGVDRFAEVGGGGLDGDIQQLVTGGRKIQAIKLYRERTGVGLAEAKDAIEAWERSTQARLGDAHRRRRAGRRADARRPRGGR